MRLIQAELFGGPYDGRHMEVDLDKGAFTITLQSMSQLVGPYDQEQVIGDLEYRMVLIDGKPSLTPEGRHRYVLSA